MGGGGGVKLSQVSLKIIYNMMAASQIIANVKNCA